MSATSTEGNALDYDALWNKAGEQAEVEASQLYPDHEPELRKKKKAELQYKYFRQMAYP